MKVALCYTKNTPKGRLIYDHLKRGILANGDLPVELGFAPSDIKQLDRCSVSVQICEYNPHSNKKENLVRKRIKKTQEKAHRRRVIVDTGFICNGRTTDTTSSYMALGYDNIKRRAKYYNENSPSDRFDALGIKIKPWRHDGRHIVVFGQNEIGVSSYHTDIIGWFEKTIAYLNNTYKRPVIYRTHPNQKVFPKGNYTLKPFVGNPIENDLEDAWCAVAFTTNAAIDAVIHGIPVFVGDDMNMAWDVAEKNIANLKSPAMPDREQWLYNLAYAQWSIKELATKQPWEHLRKFAGVRN